MPSRRRRRERRASHGLVERAVPRRDAGRRAEKAEARRRAEFELRLARLRRWRTVVGSLAFLPLGASLLCATGIEAVCIVPRELYLGIWAALFGSFLGLTVRMWRERRRFERSAAA